VKLFLILRSTVFAIGQIVSLILVSVLGQLTRPFSMKKRYAFMKLWAKFIIWWARVTCGLTYRVHGAEHIDESRASLILSRHESAWETFALQEIFPRQAFVLKRELLKIPFFGWGMSLLNPIAIDRSAGRKALNQMLSEGTARIQEGAWVVVFPEGTRMPPNELGKINIGGTMLAKKANAPVYLVGHNAGRYWSKGSFIKKPGCIDVYIREPMDVSELSNAEINAEIEAWLTKYSIDQSSF